jgi:hypothetical protein
MLIDATTDLSVTSVSDSKETTWFDSLLLIILIYIGFSTYTTTPVLMSSNTDGSLLNTGSSSMYSSTSVTGK